MNVYIIDAVRTAIGNFQGSLANLSSVDLGKVVVEGLLKRQNIAKEDIEEILLGNVLQSGQGQNIARQVAISAGIPAEKTALTLNMVCGSGLRAIAMAASQMKAGDNHFMIAGGTESMSQAPYLLKKARNGFKMGHGEIMDSMIHDGLWDIFNNYHMGITAENLAKKYDITREAQDEFAAKSQQKAQKALEENRFENEIIPVLIPQKGKDPLEFKKDEFVRFGTTAESLSKLRPAFDKNGTVTAGNASGINDGAAVVLLASEKMVQEKGLKPMAKIVSYAWHGCDPSIMGIGPVEAVREALKKASWNIQDLDLIEANEAFAAQALAVSKELKWDMNKVNVNGGAIAIGHPIGGSGSRILVSLVHEMQKRKAQKGLATLCIGGGMGIAMCVELVKI